MRLCVAGAPGARFCRLALALLASSVGGCAHTPGPAPGVAQAARASASYAATLRVSVDAPHLRGRARVLLAFARPDRLRVELPGPSGARLVAVARGGRLWAVFPGEAAYFSGPADIEQMDALLGLALTPEEVMDVLVGHAPPRLRAYQARWRGALPSDVRGTFAGGGRFSVKVTQAETPASVPARAFDEPPHDGYRLLDVHEARALWGGR